MPRRWRRSDAAARGQNLPEFRALLHLEMRDRAVAIADLEIQFFVALGRLGQGFCLPCWESNYKI